MNNSGANIVSCLTPPGTGAIATIAARGPMAWPAIRRLFQPASKRPLPDNPTAGAVWFGRIGDSGLADEVVLTVKQIEPTPWLEIHGHGGQQVVAWLLEALEGQGLKPASWVEFLEEVEPPWRAAALACLARTTTLRTAAILLDQVNGALQRAIGELQDDWQAGRIEAAQRRIDELLKFSPLGRHLVEPWRVVVAGAPNVGKSSLVNALAGYQRSVVADAPGTTRDMVSTRLALDGWPVELLDTAGLREEASGLEQAGIDLTRTALETADLCVWVVDATAESPEWPGNPAVPAIVAINKCDQPSRWSADDAQHLKVSALTGEGIAGLAAAIARKLVAEVPPAGAGIPFLASQIALLGKLRATVESGDRALAGQLLRRLSGED